MVVSENSMKEFQFKKRGDQFEKGNCVFRSQHFFQKIRQFSVEPDWDPMVKLRAMFLCYQQDH